MKRLLTILIPALCISACGGNGESTQAGSTAASIDTQPAAITKPQFISRADNLCVRFNNRYNRALNQMEAIQDANDPALPATMDEQAAAISGEAQALQGLTPPPGDEAAFQKLLDGFGEEQRLLASQASAVRAGDHDTGLALNEQLLQVESRTRGIAEGYGFEVCG